MNKKFKRLHNAITYSLKINPPSLILLPLKMTNLGQIFFTFR